MHPRDRRLVRKVSPSDLKRYLWAHGWQMISTKRTDLIKFKSPLEFNIEGRKEHYEILVPLNEKISDFFRMIEIAIEDISLYYNKGFDDILSNILYFGDTYEIGVVSEGTSKGAMPLSRGIQLYEHWSDTIAYALCASLSPMTKKFARQNKDAKNYVERSLIGNNLPGSFIATVYCPLPYPKDKTLSGNLSNPLGREATLHILRGLQYLNESTIEGDAEPIIENYQMGFNFNMCGSLSKLIDVSEGGKLGINVILESAYEIPKDIVHTRFILDSSYKKYLDDAQEALNDVEIEDDPLPTEQELEGYVIQLKRDPNDEERTIKLIATAKGVSNVLPVKTILNEEMYQVAIDAHRNQQKVSISGILEKIGRFWYLKKPSNLRIDEDRPRKEEPFEKFLKRL
jgi:hypothetical protein